MSTNTTGTTGATGAKKTSKYRPALSNAQVTHILYLAKSEQPISQLSMEIIGVLAPFQAKIDNNAMVAAYVTSSVPAPSLLDTLEVLNPVGINTEHTRAESSDIGTCGSKEQYWKACYSKLETQGVASCSLAEIQAANEHRYINDLMSPEEEAQYDFTNNN